MNNNNTNEHYDNLANNYDELWFYSEGYVNKLTNEIIKIIDLSVDDKFVDLGCGTGIYSKSILKEIDLKKKSICSDISKKMIEQAKKNIFAEFRTVSALEFSKKPIKYDKLLIKEVIHHIEKKEELIRNIYTQLNEKGICLILLLPPKIEYPLFKKAIELYEKNQPDYKDISMILRNEGFDVEEKEISIPLSIPKAKYFNMIENRYMSLLSDFSEKEIHTGISSLRKKYNNRKNLNFNDRFIALKGSK